MRKKPANESWMMGASGSAVSHLLVEDAERVKDCHEECFKPRFPETAPRPPRTTHKTNLDVSSVFLKYSLGMKPFLRPPRPL